MPRLCSPAAEGNGIQLHQGSHIDDCLKDLAARTADIPDTNKPTVLGAAATYKGAHGIEGVYSKYAVFNAISANDVTTGISNLTGGVLVDKEQILGWDPQYIFLDSGGVGLVKQDYAATPGFYRQLQAVNNRNVYQYPSSTSYYSNVEIPLVNSYYVASLIYPDQFKDINFEEKANEIFKFFLGADDYLRVLNESGFVGLVAPHIMRRFVGNDYRYLIPCSAAAGALLLILADTFARLIIAPVILPIGAITSFLGAPLFLYLLFRGFKTSGAR